MKSFLSVGECMVELLRRGDGSLAEGFAGDTFNTAWYARRLLGDDWSVAYASCIGQDALSARMAGFIAAEGIDTAFLRRIEGRSVGLYMIAVEEGERSFTYWRDQSAARLLGEDGAWLDTAMRGRDVIHLSGITLAILPAHSRIRLLNALRRARDAGSRIAFDTNIRPRLWSSEAAARDALTSAAGIADWVLPSFDEESALFGDASPAATLARYRAAGAGCIAVKNGAEPVRLWSAAEGEVQVAPTAAEPVDTTAAGDSFAAAFLAARLKGASLSTAGARAARLAAKVIAAPGALVRAAVE